MSISKVWLRLVRPVLCIPAGIIALFLFGVMFTRTVDAFTAAESFLDHYSVLFEFCAPTLLFFVAGSTALFLAFENKPDASKNAPS